MIFDIYIFLPWPFIDYPFLSGMLLELISMQIACRTSKLSFKLNFLQCHVTFNYNVVNFCFSALVLLKTERHLRCCFASKEIQSAVMKIWLVSKYILSLKVVSECNFSLEWLLIIKLCLTSNFSHLMNFEASFSIKCGGPDKTSASGIKFDDDSEILGAASLYTNTNYNWAVSTTGTFISNPKGPQYIARTDSQITGTLDSEIYKTARISASSLRYFGLNLKNGLYTIDLHFAEIAIEDSQSWRALGRRLFDVYIQVQVSITCSGVLYQLISIVTFLLLAFDKVFEST